MDIETRTAHAAAIAAALRTDDLCARVEMEADTSSDDVYAEDMAVVHVWRELGRGRTQEMAVVWVDGDGDIMGRDCTRRVAHIMAVAAEATGCPIYRG
jgi:hypothetical protein